MGVGHTQESLFNKDPLYDQREHYGFNVNLVHGFDRAAGYLDETPDKFVDKMLSERQEFRMHRDGKYDFQALTMPGVRVRSRTPGVHDWTQKGVPDRGSIRLAVILPSPSYVEYNSGTIDGRYLNGLLKMIWDTTDITPYDTDVTFAIKFVPPKGVIKQTYVTECRPVLQYEMDKIRPEVILAMSAHSLKALGNSKTKTDNVYGTDVATYGSWKARLFYSGAPSFDVSPKLRDGVESSVKRMADSLSGVFSTTEEYINEIPEHKNYRVLRTAQEVKDAVELILDRNKDGPIYLALDCEWGRESGTVDTFKNNKTLLVQFSDRPHEAFAISLRGQHLKELHNEACYTSIIDWIRYLVCHPRVLLAGHNLKSDILQLTADGIDCRANYHFDTMTAFHLLKPHTERHGLEEIALIYTDLGRYDRGLNLWLQENSSNKEVEDCGYAMIPEEVIMSYSLKDVDAVMQAWPKIVAELQANQLAPEYSGYEMDGIKITNQYEAYQYVMHKCDKALVDLEYNGVPADPTTMRELEPMYRNKAEYLLNNIKIRLGWLKFNPSSPLDMPFLLFGLIKRPNSCPGTVKSLKLTPVKTTGKYPMLWEEMDDEEKQDNNPATDAETLRILKEDALAEGREDIAELLDMLWKFRLVNQICNQMLHAPTTYDTNGNPIYTTGYIGLCGLDNRIHGTFLQLTQTGRLNSRNPNLNNQSGSAERFCLPMFLTPEGQISVDSGETDLSTVKWMSLVEDGLVDKRYKPVRSILRAKPGWVLIGADYSQAELFTLACVAEDEAMKAIMFDPLKDVHSMICVSSFKVDVPPDVEDLKKWVEANGYKDLRNAAKSVIFGIIYGRGPSSILRQIKSYGIEMTLEEVVQIIENVYIMFPKVKEYIEKQKRAVSTVGYAENPYGRRRYFFPSPWNGVMKAQERESVDFPIQSTVGDVLPVAMSNFATWKEQNPSYKFELVLPYHDAVYLHVPIEEIDMVVEHVIPLCMSEQAEIPNIGLKLKVDTDIMFYFGTKGKRNDIITTSLAATEYEPPTREEAYEGPPGLFTEQEMGQLF